MTDGASGDSANERVDAVRGIRAVSAGIGFYLRQGGCRSFRVRARCRRDGIFVARRTRSVSRRLLVFTTEVSEVTEARVDSRPRSRLVHQQFLDARPWSRRVNASMPFAVSAPFPLASVSIRGKAVVVPFGRARCRRDGIFVARQTRCVSRRLLVFTTEVSEVPEARVDSRPLSRLVNHLFLDARQWRRSVNASMPFAVSAPFPLASVSIRGKAVVVPLGRARAPRASLAIATAAARRRAAARGGTRGIAPRSCRRHRP